ncbi:MAG: hypothetical protein R2748_19760 [Bryobacterales bacterium]
MPPPLAIAAPQNRCRQKQTLALALIPGCNLGGAERVIVELMQGLAGEADFAVLPASPRGTADAAFFSAPGGSFRRPRAITRRV